MILETAKTVFQIEAEAIANLVNQIDNDFKQAAEDILNSQGKLIVSGMGKSGIIGKKMAATFASTGTPSFFLHPGEAYHGDLGMIEAKDVVLLISNSGETDEVLKLIPYLQHHQIKTISMTGNPESTLAKNTHYHLNIAVPKEACPLQLAPTSSTTATLVMGDGLAVVLMQLRNFKDENFAQFHPGGSLGRRLLTRIKDVMHSTDLPICSPTDPMQTVVSEISRGKCGLAVVQQDNTIVGIVTDGDVRRCMEAHSQRFFQLSVADIMTQSPKTIEQNSKLQTAQELMTTHKINSLLVLDDEGKLAGVVQLYDVK